MAWTEHQDQPMSPADPTRQSLDLASTITCPACGERSSETMPTDACLYFYDCPACGVRLKPKPGDCCVFCSYGTTPCPPQQTSAEEPCQ
jgi:hypothetical protein